MHYVRVTLLRLEELSVSQAKVANCLFVSVEKRKALG